MASLQKITPFLWFDDNMEEAVTFYLSVFKNSKIVMMNAMTSRFELEGQPFMALKGGPTFKFNEAVSFFVTCKDQEEVDYFWDALTAQGGAEGQCGWLKDKFGLSWQIIPEALMRHMAGKDPAKAERVTQAMLKMKKIIVADLDAAAAG